MDGGGETFNEIPVMDNMKKQGLTKKNLAAAENELADVDIDDWLRNTIYDKAAQSDYLEAINIINTLLE